MISVLLISDEGDNVRKSAPKIVNILDKALRVMMGKKRNLDDH